jgi:RNase adaptor protein for sRNA GlmZ degradation
MNVTVISFGYGHEGICPPVADITVDARRCLRNPHHDPAMREPTGLDDAVRRHVLATPGARGLILFTAATAHYLATVTGQPVTVATGCTGGRHRAVALAEGIAADLRYRDVQVTVIHRDIDKPLLYNATHQREVTA